MEFSQEQMLERTIQWANVNSGSYNIPGIERLAALIAQAFSALGCEANVLSLPPMDQVDTKGNVNKQDLGPLLRFWKRSEAPVQVLLVGHMDTVFGVEHPFQEVVKVSDKIIRGPGVIDMKGGISIMLEALLVFEKSKQAQNLGWEVIINPDEEIGSIGSAPFLEERAKKHHVGLLFEPAMDEAGTLAGNRKGSGNFVVVVHGRAAHAGRDFHQGRNAITALARIVSKIDGMNNQREGVTINVGQIQGGDAINIVPEKAICRIDVRTRAVEDEDWLNKEFKQIIEEANQQEGIRVEFLGHFTRKPKNFDAKTQKLYDLVQELAKELGQTISWKPSGGCCDGNNLASAGLPNVDTLGVCGGKIHSSEEYLLIDSLVPRAKLICAILQRLSEKGF